MTSYLPNAARNFGLEEEIPHDQRYRIADEYLDVLYKLWEGSWDDDAVVVDREQRVYTDPSKVRYIHHTGEHYKVAGPHLCQPSRQRTPLLFQATGSPAGIEFAGRHAEAIFTGGSSAEEVQRNIKAIREKAREHGRDPAGIKFFVGASVIVARTEAEVQDKLRTYHELHSVDASLVHLQSPIDFTQYPRDTRLRDIVPEGDSTWGLRWVNSEETVGAVLDKFRFRQDRFFVAGTPDHVADTIEKWLDEDGIDGINLIQYLSYGTAKDFIELVVPELRRRGRFREQYEDDETLRERFFGKGYARLPDDHFGARYRNAENLQVPAEPLTFSKSKGG